MLSSVLPSSLSSSASTAAKYAQQAGPSSKQPQPYPQPGGRFAVRVFKAPLFGSYTHSQQPQQPQPQQNWYPAPYIDPKRFAGPIPNDGPKPPLRVISNTAAAYPRPNPPQGQGQLSYGQGQQNYAPGQGQNYAPVQSQNYTSGQSQNYAPGQSQAQSYAIYPSSSGTFIYEQSICSSKSDLYSNTDASTSTLTLGLGFSPALSSDSTLEQPATPIDDAPRQSSSGPNSSSFATLSNSNSTAPGVRFPGPSAPPAPYGFITHEPYTPTTQSEAEIDAREAVARVHADWNSAPSGSYYSESRGASPRSQHAATPAPPMSASRSQSQPSQSSSFQGGYTQSSPTQLEPPRGGQRPGSVYFPSAPGYAPPPAPNAANRRLSADSQDFTPGFNGAEFAPSFSGALENGSNTRSQDPQLQRRGSQTARPPSRAQQQPLTGPPSNVSGHGGYTTPSISESAYSSSTSSSSTSGPPSVLRQQSSGPRPEIGGPRTPSDASRRQEELAAAVSRASSPQGDYFSYRDHDPSPPHTSPVPIPEQRPRRDSMRTPAPASPPDRRPSYQEARQAAPVVLSSSPTSYVPPPPPERQRRGSISAGYAPRPAEAAIAFSSSPTSYAPPPPPPAERQRRGSTSAGYAPRPTEVPLPSNRGTVPPSQQTSPTSERRRNNEYDNMPRSRQSPIMQQSAVTFSEPPEREQRTRVLSNPPQPPFPTINGLYQRQDAPLPPQPAVQFPFGSGERPAFPGSSSGLSGSRFPTSHPADPASHISFPDSQARPVPPEPQRRHSDSDRSSMPVSQGISPPPEPQRRYSDGDQMLPPRPGSSGRNSGGPLGRCVRWNENLICPSPVFPCNRRKGWFNRRGDQLWTNDGAYKPATSGQQYPPDLDEYPEYGSGWMNEEGIRIDMGHRLIPKAPLRSALKQTKVSI